MSQYRDTELTTEVPVDTRNRIANDLPHLAVQPWLTTSRGILFAGDCLDIIKSIRDESVHCLFADPPFNLGKDYDNGVSDNLKDEEYLNWTRQWLVEAIRVLVPGGSLFVYNLPKWLIHLGHFLSSQMVFRHWIAMTMKSTFPRGNYLYPAHYGLIYFTKGEPRVFNKTYTPIPTCRHCGNDIKDYGGHRDKLNDEGLNLSDFWEDTSPVRHSKFKTRVANELNPMVPERAILVSTNPGDVVLDPFGGGGSTYQMAEMHNRRWIGVELGPCEPIEERLQHVPEASIGDRPPEVVTNCFN